MMNKIIKELKNRYQANTGKSVGLTKQGELDVRVESSSRVRCWATARCEYKIGGLTGVVNIKEPSEDNIEKSLHDFLQLAAGKKDRIMTLELQCHIHSQRMRCWELIKSGKDPVYFINNYAKISPDARPYSF